MTTIGKHWKWSDDSKKKLSKTAKDNGIIPPSQKGKKRTEETRKRNSLGHLGISHKQSNDTKEKLRKVRLITLCRSCHSKTNYNREYWIGYFEGMNHE